MHTTPTRRWTVPLAGLLLAGATALQAQTAVQAKARVTTPEEFFGHPIGADYVLPDYTQFTEYWRTLDAESDRMTVQSIGKTAEGRDQLMAIITSPENHANLARYQQIARRLARAEGVDEAEARRLAAEGKAVVWIDGGLHATEVLGAQQLMETVFQLVSRDDPETLRILDDVIILAVHANPDGMELVSDWYMRNPVPEERSTRGIPRLYQKYIGHDNNRDFYMSTQPETENMNRIMFREWYPQIVYNHHQTGPTGTVLFAPPFRDPFNYNIDPLVITSLDQVGGAMHGRFVQEGKGGATMRRGANYSTWWNGGLRTVTYFHNMIGLLTETIGNPTPIEIPFVANRQLPSGDLPLPVQPQKWHFRQSIEYSVTANYAVLDYASRFRETLLFNIWRMGMNSIERGSRDHWTVWPKRIEEVRQALADETKASLDADGMAVGGLMANPPDDEESRLAMSLLYRPEWRDPRGYIIPADQPDFPTATKFVEALLETGVVVHRATADFTVNGKTYPAGSFVVKTAQAFRPHVMDMFEPQDHPNDFRYPGGPPIPPYDATGWTLPYQMGIDVVRVLDAFDGPFEPIEGADVAPPPGIVEPGPAKGWLLSPAYNDAFIAMNRLLADDADVYRLAEPWTHDGETYPAGTFFIPTERGVRDKLVAMATELGISFDAASEMPSGEHYRVRPVRIGLWDRYGGSMPSGWTRWLFEQFEFPFEVVYPKRLDEGDLRDDFDVLVFVDGAIPEDADDDGRRGRFDESSIPEEYRHMLGRVTIEKTVPQIQEFLEDGGTVLTIGGSTALAMHLGLPVGDHLVDENGEHLPMEEYFIPGSILEARVDVTRPVAFGLDERVDVMFNRSPVLRLEPGAETMGIRSVAWYDGPEPLRSGWAWGQQHLEGGAAVIEAPVGDGMLYLFAPEVLYRGQSHGTFKFVFNPISLARAERTEVR
ncbi:MAG TPA: M14 family metallopeptidase [Longimicrobiales bacterium]